MKRTPLKRKSALRRSGRLKPMSKKRARESREYAVLRRVFLVAHPICQAWGCTNPATQIHHMAYRGKNYLDTSKFFACCFRCHRAIHEQPKWARKMGYLV